MAQKIKNIGFILRDPNWHGGINYLRSLTSAISLLKKKDINIYLFTSSDQNLKILNNFQTKIIKSFFFNQNLINRIINKFSFLLFNKNIFIERVLKKYKINILSHTNYTNFKGIKTVSWIGDFQYIHYPNFFGKLIVERNKTLHDDLVKNSNKVIVSCNFSKNDFLKRYINFRNKVNILKFVPTIIEPKKLLKFSQIKKRYNISKNFYFVPNQFWKHKNHECIFKAIKYLNSKKIFPNIVFAGKLDDYRNPDFINKVKEILNSKKIKNLKYLGELKYIEICSLLYNCKAVINPSFFEGWSTSVEESKIYNKTCILSNIPTHLEQKPRNGIYFNPNNFKELAEVIQKLEKKKSNNLKFNKKKYVNEKKKFAIKYLEILDQI